jgi:hypothetical protein
MMSFRNTPIDPVFYAQLIRWLIINTGSERYGLRFSVYMEIYGISGIII